jgi:hypothetical protein
MDRLASKVVDFNHFQPTRQSTRVAYDISHKSLESRSQTLRGPIMNTDPILIPKSDLQPIIERIGHADSPVGIDAQYTHAIIITYLQQISARLDAIESKLQATRA